MADVSIGMATIPSRQESAQQALRSLEGQGDIYVTLNGFNTLPDWTKFYDATWRVEPENVGDAGKFLFPQEGYCFTVDDDIIYPEDYVERTITSMEMWSDLIVGYHGKRVQGNNFHSFPVLHFRLNVPYDTMVDILGTGVMAWNAEDITFPEEIFTLFNQADVNVAVHARKQSVGMMCLSHTQDMFKPIFHNENIWDDSLQWNDKIMAKLGEAF